MKSILSLLLFCLISISSSAQKTEAKIQKYLELHADELHLTASDINNWEIQNEHTDKNLGVTYAYVIQTVNKHRVYNTVSTFAITESNTLLTGNRFVSNVEGKINTTEPAISSAEALEEVCNTLGIQQTTFREISTKNGIVTYDKGNISLEDIPVKLVYTPVGDQLILSWDLSLYQTNAEHWWSIRIDATTGLEIDRVDWVAHCDFGESHAHTSACTSSRESNSMAASMAPPPPPTTDQYRVFELPVESPNHGGRSLAVGPFDAVSSPFGWHDDNGIAGNEYTITRGNNVHAYEDANDNNAPGYSPNGGSLLNFDFALNSNQAPANYLDPAITNLFYMNNVMHDIWYRYGFDEASGNFQENNYGNGGQDADYVRAEAQDGGGMNNANFATPTDGNRPRMQMYLWTNSGNDTLTINSPAIIAGNYSVKAAGFGPGLPIIPITSDLVIFEDGVGESYDACDVATNGSAINGKICILRRGSCTFVDKVTRAQNEGAVAVIVVNNVAGAPFSMGGNGPGVTIPSIMISNADGNLIINEIENGSTVNATIVGTPSFDLDGDFDNGIIAHEYGHGISIRLTGGAGNSNCLNNDEQMGEGWSDWFGLMLTMNPSDVSTDNRGVGTFVLGEPTNGVGIRPAPYNTDFAVNDYTYAATNNTGAISQPHGIGFVWCTMLWDMTWALIDQYGFDPDLYNGTGGNNLAMELVIQGIKLQPCNPGFVDGRNAILQADQLLNNGANQCLLWNVFANRGLGHSAIQGNTDSRTDQVEAFDLPPGFTNVTGSENVTSCDTYDWTEAGQSYASSGIYVETLLSAAGCDSTVTLDLTINSSTSGSQNVTNCESYFWPANGVTYTNDGIYTTTLTNAQGCDSTLSLDLVVLPAASGIETISNCDSFTWPANGTTYTSGGMYSATLTSANGCDSIATLDLTINTANTSSMTVSECESYTWAADGSTYTNSGQYTAILINSFGCDSTVTLDLTILPTDLNSTNMTACDSYTWPSNGTTYAASGLYQDLQLNNAGCDSLLELNLTINQSTSSTENATSCDSYTWALDGNQYTNSGSYQTILTNSEGCDSTITLDLIITQSTTSQETLSSCDSYVWSANGTEYFASGTYQTVLANADGCDSTLTLDLTINTVSATANYVDDVVLSADLMGANYIWLDCADNFNAIPGATDQQFTATQNGSYAVIVTANNCSDTSACLVVSNVGIDGLISESIQLYPNPTSGFFIVDFGAEYKDVDVIITNALGQIVSWERNLNGSSLELNLNEADGTYFVEVVKESEALARFRLIKSN